MSEKPGLVEFADKLLGLNFQLLGSRGTALFLREQGLPCRDIAEFVGPPILGHRVVTLSREIHAALLATNSTEDQAELERIGVPRIDLVYVNFYPLGPEICREGSTLESVIEKTDIGGPTLLRSAAKGRRIVLCRPQEFPIALKYLHGGYGGDDAESRIISRLASIAEAEVAAYCHISATYHRTIATPTMIDYEDGQLTFVG